MTDGTYISSTTGTSTMAVCPICEMWLNYVGQPHPCNHPQCWPTYQPDYVAVLNRNADALELIAKNLETWL